MRGVYARRDLPPGHVLRDEDLYLAVPLQAGQLSCRETMRGQVLLEAVKADSPVRIENVDSPYAHDPKGSGSTYLRAWFLTP